MVNNKNNQSPEDRWHELGSSSMRPDTKKLLDTAGSWLIQRVRKTVLLELSKLVRGQMKGVLQDEYRKYFAIFDDTHEEAFLWLVKQSVDTTLHQLMSSIDESDEIVFGVHDEADRIQELKEWSDGLTGELLSWIDQFE